MAFYDLSPDKRKELVTKIEGDILQDFINQTNQRISLYFANDDTYIRKSAYLAVGRIYFTHNNLKKEIIQTLRQLFSNENEKVRQTVVNALGEIGKVDANEVLELYRHGLRDKDHTVRNAIIGSLKKMGEKNPESVLKFARKYLHDPNQEIRRQVIHGIELRGRTHPEDVLPLLKEVQNEQNKRVRNIIIHVIGQISYKKGCLEKVVSELKTWKNKELVKGALDEILATHKSYEKFSSKSYDEASEYISSQLLV